MARYLCTRTVHASSFFKVTLPSSDYLATPHPIVHLLYKYGLDLIANASMHIMYLSVCRPTSEFVRHSRAQLETLQDFTLAFNSIAPLLFESLLPP